MAFRKNLMDAFEEKEKTPSVGAKSTALKSFANSKKPEPELQRLLRIAKDTTVAGRMEREKVSVIDMNDTSFKQDIDPGFVSSLLKSRAKDTFSLFHLLKNFPRLEYIANISSYYLRHSDDQRENIIVSLIILSIRNAPSLNIVEIPKLNHQKFAAKILTEINRCHRNIQWVRLNKPDVKDDTFKHFIHFLSSNTTVQYIDYDVFPRHGFRLTDTTAEMIAINDRRILDIINAISTNPDSKVNSINTFKTPFEKNVEPTPGERRYEVVQFSHACIQTAA